MRVKNENGQYIQSWEHYKLILTQDESKAQEFVEWVAKGNATLLNRSHSYTKWFAE